MSLFREFQKLGKQSITYGAGTIIQRLASIVLLPLYTSVLTPEDFAILGLVQLTGRIVEIILSLSASSALFRSFYDYPDNDIKKMRKVVISTAIFIKIPIAIFLLLIAFFLSGSLSVFLFDSHDYKTYFFIIIVQTVFTLFNQIPFAVFRVQQKPTTYITFRLIFFLLRLGLIIYFVAGQKMGVLGVLSGGAITSIVSFIVLFWAIRRDLVLKFSRFEARKMLRYGIPLVFGGIFGFASTYLDRYALNFLSSLGELGLYTLAYSFGMLLLPVLITPLKMVVGPLLLSMKDEPQFQPFVARALTYVVVVGGFLYLGIALLSKEIIQLMAKPEFWDAYAAIPIIALAYYIWSMRTFMEVGVLITRQTKVVAFYTFVGAVLNLALNLWLIPDFGMMGAAYATLISFSVTLAIDFALNRRLYRIDYEWIRVAKVYLVVAIVFILGYLPGFENVYIAFVSKLGVILILYPSLLFIIRFFTSEEMTRAKQFILLSTKRFAR